MMSGVVCNVCDGTEFTINAGFYYCDNCGERITKLQQIEDQNEGINQFESTVKAKVHKIKEVDAQKENIELTSWETYNYILYGFVNELIYLGCKDELMLTTLQLWSTYLRKHQVAFFSKRDTNLPKFPLNYKIRDAQIIYNIPKKRRVYSSSASTHSGSSHLLTKRKRARAIGMKRKSLANVEYDEYLSSQKSDISSIGFNLSQQSSTNVSSENSEASFQIEFSRRTRQQAKMKMTKQHFSEHRNDLTNKLKCHKETSKDAIGRSFVYSLLWLALNQIDDDLQLADLMRYAKESHIKQNNISSFLPPNMSSIQATNNFRKKSTDFQTHFALRSKAHHIARVINVRNIKLPDLPKLCARYVKELCLPPIIAEMAEKLIVFYPPHMKTEYKNALISAIPNFEGRAMAYIVFLLKLFFGLDDSREIRISSATQKINKTLVDIGAREEEILFVWSEWKEYIDMRNVILSQCHYPTALLVDPNVRLPVDLYVDFLQRINEDSTYEETYRKNEMENIRVIFDEVVKLHERQGGKRSNNSLHFSPSLTPFRSYMEQILDNTSIKSRIYIPAFMNVNHEKRDILAYLKPKRLKKSLRAHGLYVKVEELAYSEHVEFTNINFINTKQTENVKFSFDITKNEWIEMLRNRKEQNENAENEAIQQWNDGIKLNVDAHLNGLREKEKSKRASKVLEGRLNVSVTASSETDGNQSDIPSSAYQYFDEEEKDAIDDIRLKEPRRNLDQLPNILENVSSDEDEDERTDVESGFHNDALNEESVNFLVTNFDFWIAMENIYFLTNASFEEKFPKFPASFQWLLKQCAMHTHMHPKDLYIELLAIEAQFRYVLKPIFKMDNCIKFRDTSKLDAKTANAVRLLNRIW